MMKNSEFKVIITILTLIIALGIFLGGFTLYKKFGVERPLADELDSINSIEEVIINKNKIYEVQVKFNTVNNLDEVYQDVLTICDAKLGENNYNLVLLNNPNNKLSQTFTRLQPILHEALAKNEFVWLDDNLNLLAKEEVLDYQLFIDEEYLYIQLKDGDFFIYKVLNRLPEAQAIS